MGCIFQRINFNAYFDAAISAEKIVNAGKVCFVADSGITAAASGIFFREQPECIEFIGTVVCIR